MSNPTGPTPTPPRERFVLTFEAEPSAIPPEIRLRQLLKHAGRSLGLKCVSARCGDGKRIATAGAQALPEDDAAGSAASH